MTHVDRSPMRLSTAVLFAWSEHPDPSPSGHSELLDNTSKAEDNTVPDPSQSQASAPNLSAAKIQLDEFIAVASRAALQVLAERQVALNPQPLPPGEAAVRPGGRIIIGLVLDDQ